MLHTQDPHIPYRLRRSLVETFGPSPVDLDGPGPDEASADNGAFRRAGTWAAEFWDWGRLRSGRARDELERIVAFYDSEIAWADRALGQLFEELESLPDTVVVVTADHGEEFGDHGQFEHGHSLYDELLRVPLLVRLPGGRHAGVVVDEPVSLVDVAPTLVHLAGAEPLPRAEGRPLFAVDAEARERRRDGVLAEAMLRGPERAAIVSGRYKYVFSLPLGHLHPFPRELALEDGLTGNVGKEELYDLEDDPGETRDLASREPETAARLRRLLFDYLEEHAHGLHLRCRAPAGFELQLAATATLAHVQPLGLEADDEVEIDASRRRLVFRSPAGADDDWWIVRLLDPGARLSLRARAASRMRFFVGGAEEPAEEASLAFALGDPRLAVPPGDAPAGDGPWCRVWQVAGAAPASGRALDSGIVEQLRALGYL